MHQFSYIIYLVKLGGTGKSPYLCNPKRGIIPVCKGGRQEKVRNELKISK